MRVAVKGAAAISPGRAALFPPADASIVGIAATGSVAAGVVCPWRSFCTARYSTMRSLTLSRS
jgi:hypothetical protein